MNAYHVLHHLQGAQVQLTVSRWFTELQMLDGWQVNAANLHPFDAATQICISLTPLTKLHTARGMSVHQSLTPPTKLHTAWGMSVHQSLTPLTKLHTTWGTSSHQSPTQMTQLHATAHVYMSHRHHWPNSTLHGVQVPISHWHKWANSMLQHMSTWATDTTDQIPHCMGHECTSVTDTSDQTPHCTSSHQSLTQMTKLHTAQVHISHWHKWPNSTLHKFTSVTDTNDQTPHCTSSHQTLTQMTKLHTAQVHISHRHKWPNSLLQHMFTRVTDTTDQTPHYSTSLCTFDCLGWKYILKCVCSTKENMGNWCSHSLSMKRKSSVNKCKNWQSPRTQREQAGNTYALAALCTRWQFSLSLTSMAESETQQHGASENCHCIQYKMHITVNLLVWLEFSE